MGTGDLTEAQQLAVISDRVRAMHDEQKTLAVNVTTISEQLHRMEVERVGSDATLKSSIEAAHRRLDELKAGLDLARAEMQREVAQRDRLLTEISKNNATSQEQQNRLLMEHLGRAIASATEELRKEAVAYTDGAIKALREELLEQLKPMPRLVISNSALLFLVATLIIALIGAIVEGRMVITFH